MKKYFVIGNINGYYDNMRSTLRKSGYRKTNPDHILVVCGNAFGKGGQSVQVYKFLSSIPKTQKILIKGECEFLLQRIACYGGGQLEIGRNKTKEVFEIMTQFLTTCYPGLFSGDELQTRLFFLNTGVVRWLNSDEWVNYFELDDYIFVSNWLPVEILGDNIGYQINWREATEDEWEESTSLPVDLLYNLGTYPKHKTIISGASKPQDVFCKICQQEMNIEDDRENYYLLPNLILLGKQETKHFSVFSVIK